MCRASRSPSVPSVTSRTLLRPPMVDVAIAAAFVAFAVAEGLAGPGDQPWWRAVAGGFAAALLAWRRQAPILVAALVVLVNVLTDPEAQFSTLLSLVLVCFTVGYETRPPRSLRGPGDRARPLHRRQHRRRLRAERPRRRPGVLRRPVDRRLGHPRPRHPGRGGRRARRPARGRARAGGRPHRPAGTHPDRPRAARHRVPLDQRGDHPDPGRTAPARPRPRARRPRTSPPSRPPPARRWPRCAGSSACCAPTGESAVARPAARPVRARPAGRAGGRRRHARARSASRATPSTCQPGRRPRGVPDRPGGPDQRRCGTAGATDADRHGCAGARPGSTSRWRTTGAGCATALRTAGTAWSASANGWRCTAARCELEPAPSGGIRLAATPPVEGHRVSDVTRIVVIVDDQGMVRAGFKLAARGRTRPRGRRRGLQRARRRRHRSPSSQPDVTLMDIRMPVLDGIAATRHLVEAGVPTRVLVLTTFDLDEYVFEALRAGRLGLPAQGRARPRSSPPRSAWSPPGSPCSRPGSPVG